MHTRLNLLASRRRLRNGLRFSSSVSRSTPLVRTTPRLRLRPRPLEWRHYNHNHTHNHTHNHNHPNHHNQTSTVSISNLHTTSQALASPATAALLDAEDPPEQRDDDNNDLNSDLEFLANAQFSKLMPKDIYMHTSSPKNTAISSLDQELGLDNIWDDSQDDALYDSEDNGVEMEDGIALDETSKEEQLLFDASGDQRMATQKRAMQILINFDPDHRPPKNRPEELQLWLECAAQRDAVMKFQQIVDKARDRKAYDSMSIMQKHVVQWHERIRDAIEIRQKEYLANEDKRVGRKRYGPFLCSLHAEKMAVILAHEAITNVLLLAGKNGKEGVPLIKMAIAIGSAVETEVISQRRIKERFHTAKVSNSNGDDDENDTDASTAANTTTIQSQETDQPKTAMDRWKFSASHLKTFMDELQRNDPKMGRSKRAIDYAMRKARQAINTEDGWLKEDIVHVGAALLSILIENSSARIEGAEEPAFRVEKAWSDAKSVSHIIFNDNLRKLFTEDEYLSFAATTTRHTPMIVPPTEWTGPHEGGYRWLEVDLMRTHGSRVQREALQFGDLSQVYEGLNILGRTSWKINEEILDISQHCWDNNIPIGDIPSRTDFEVPLELERPQRIDPEIYSNRESPESKAADEANRKYRESMYKRQRIIQKNMDLVSLRCSATLKLNQASEFKDYERIYFPYNIDFRGRAYPIPPHLSNVGSDLCRGMLTFADAKPLGKRGLYWLKVHLANFAGKDKMSFDDRAKFVEDNMDKVRESVDNPFSEDPWWMSLDDPFQGLATCHEIVRAIDSGDPENYMSALPVHMDGSCNGLQHYAALGRDTVGGKAVNLLEGEGPEDVYVGVMHEVIRRVEEEAEIVLDFDVSKPDSLNRHQKKALKHHKAAKLVNGLIDRGVVKRTVMTSVYGVTYIGARQQIQEKIEEKLEEKGYDLDEIDREIFAAAGYLATVTMEVMGDLFQGARNTKSWLADCARLISQQGHPVAWISPVGIPAVQPYRQRKPRTVVTVMQCITIMDESDDLPVHKSRQCTAFPPNYVHSLDSSHMLLTAMEMDRRGLAFSAVHDSFWTHACDVDEMNGALRDCFVELYSRPLLADLKESWELRYPEVEFPELPELGKLDLNEVKSATYFFQ